MGHGSRTLLDEGVYRSQLDVEGKLPFLLFLPQAYEPGYSYPLLILLHGHGQRETDWVRIVPQMSRRNYVCIGLRGPHGVHRRDRGMGYGWGRGRRSNGALEDYLLAAIGATREMCNVHAERVFLAGFCEGASVAYQLGFTLSGIVKGVVALNGWLPPGPLPLRHARGPSAPRLFIGHGTENAVVPLSKAEEAYRLLNAAGVSVQLRHYPVGHNLVPAMLRDADRWVMDACSQRPTVPEVANW